MLPSPAFSSRADVSAPFTGVFSHRGLLVGVAWQGGRGEADRCYRHKTLGLTKVDKVQLTQTLHITQQGAISSSHSGASFSHQQAFSPSLCRLPHRSLRLLLAPRFVFIPKSTCSLQSGHGVAPLGIGTRKAKAAPGLGGSCWCSVATVCLPTFSSVGQEPKLLLPSSLWEGTGFISSSTKQWLLSRTA